MEVNFDFLKTTKMDMSVSASEPFKFQRKYYCAILSKLRKASSFQKAFQ